MIGRLLFRVHRWTGLVAGGLIALVCLSGAFVALVHDYEGWFERQTVRVAPRPERLPLDRLFANARAVVPDFALYDYARLPQTEDAALEILYFPDGTYRSIFIDPYTGKLTGRLHNNLSRWLLKFHWSLGLGAQGRSGSGVVFATALVALVSLGTGVMVYRRRLFEALRWRPLRRRGATPTALHRVVAVWVGLFAVLLFGSGAYINYFIVTGVFAFPGGGALQRPPVAPLRVSLDECVRQAKQAVPGLRPLSLGFPQLEGGPVTVSGEVADESAFLYGRTTVSFDPVTGILLSVRGGRRDASAWGIVENVIFNLHYARFGGLFIRSAYAVLAMATASLPLSGLLVWRRKQRHAPRR